MDPLTDVETCAGELTFAPSAGEVIATSAPDVGVEDDEELPAEVPAELLAVVLLPDVELDPEGGVVALLAEVLVLDPELLVPVVLELPTDTLAD